MYHSYFKLIPTSQPALIRALKLVLRGLKKTPPHDLPVEARLMDRLNAFYGDVVILQEALPKAKSRRVKAIRRQKELYLSLRTLIGLYFAMLNGKITLGWTPKADRSFFGLEVSNLKKPVINTYEEAHLWAVRIWKGEAIRIAHGSPPILEPDVERIRQMGEELNRVLNEVVEADADYDRLRLEMKAKVKEGKAFVRRLWWTIEAFLTERLGGDKSAIRREGRRFGIVYYRRKRAEPVAEEDARQMDMEGKDLRAFRGILPIFNTSNLTHETIISPPAILWPYRRALRPGGPLSRGHDPTEAVYWRQPPEDGMGAGDGVDHRWPGASFWFSSGGGNS